ncbi:aerolysin family beta-barrel pore-forming toxin [Aliikangiella sp. IMCC44359]|uniref:aerolysin family beta-barrel pore-forming toxin n=1 Tax=Aliikangiella sp. IMCC44359 TaxID=3459125 RepID=UPI00403ACC64
MKKSLLTFTSTVILSLNMTNAQAELVQWKKEDGGNGKYYEVVSGRMTYNSAYQAAINRSVHINPVPDNHADPHLASINSAAENAFVHQLLIQANISNAWLSGTDEGHEGKWRWHNKWNFRYTNWRAGEPNNAGANENHLVIRQVDGFWNDLRASSIANGYVVEYDALPKLKDVEYRLDRKEYIIDDIIRDKKFHKPYFFLGHYLGFGWAGGDNTTQIGEDLGIEKETDNSYRVYAIWRGGNPGGDKKNKRLNVVFKDIEFLVDPKSLKTGEAVINYTGKTYQVGKTVCNISDSPVTSSVGISMDYESSWNKTDAFSFSSTLSVTQTYSAEVSVPGIKVGTETSFSAGFTQNQAWSETTGGSEVITLSGSDSVTVAPNQKKRIVLIANEEEAIIPYTADAHISYNVTLSGFLRWGGNAHKDHPTNRPDHTAYFGTESLGLNAAEDMIDQYFHREYNLPNLEWDWQWTRENYGLFAMRNTLRDIGKRKYKAKVAGNFVTKNALDYYTLVTDEGTINNGQECDVFL